MISITRTKCPPFLKRSRDAKAYSKPPVVDALWKMQHEKCCYCEIKVERKGHEKTVEHFYPRKEYKNKTNEWTNLLLACVPCNGAKLARFPVADTGDPILLDPSDESTDPESHIAFRVAIEDRDTLGTAFPKDGSERGRETIKTIGLNTRRKKRVAFISNYLLPVLGRLAEAQINNDSAKVQLVTDELRQFLSSKSEFAALARSFARHYALDKLVDR